MSGDPKPEMGDVVLYTDHNVPSIVRPGIVVRVRAERTESPGMVDLDLVVFNADCRYDAAQLIASVPRSEAPGAPGWRPKKNTS